LPDKVIQFKKTKDGVEAINAVNLKFKTFGAGVDYILQKFFGVKSLVSEYSREWIKGDHCMVNLLSYKSVFV
jgi:hypothetical protein